MRLAFSLFLIIISATLLNFSKPQQEYLPVSVLLKDTSQFSKEILFNFKLALIGKKIKTISREESMELQKQEVERMLKPYYENLKRTGGSPNFNDQKRYMSLNRIDVCNSLSIDIPVDAEGIIGDTITWSNRPLPFDMENFKMPIYKMVLVSNQKTSIMQIMQVITDSIISSNALVKRK